MTQILIVLGLAIVLLPFAKILRRTGYSGWWVLLWFVPVVNIIALWLWAFGRWPALNHPNHSN
jgi:hypothetical protein